MALPGEAGVRLLAERICAELGSACRFVDAGDAQRVEVDEAGTSFVCDGRAYRINLAGNRRRYPCPARAAITTGMESQ